MKIFTTFTATMTLGLSLFVATVANAATLVVPPQLEVKSGHAMISFKEQTVELKQGKQLLEVVYRDMFADHADDSGTWLSSEPLYVALDITKEGEYRLQLPEIKNKKQAKAFIEQPKIDLVSEQGLSEHIILLNHQQLMAKLWQVQ